MKKCKKNLFFLFVKTLKINNALFKKSDHLPHTECFKE